MLYTVDGFLRKALVSLGMIFCLMVQSSLGAGSGTLKGKVFDKDSKDELPGASVLIKGSSVGASTDLNGEYVIHNAPAGNQSVVVSYVGYAPITVDLEIPDGGTIDQNFYLLATAVQGKVVVVTAQAQGQIQAINQQLSSNKIVNVVSDAKIQELPDFNAAQAVSRLPGVSVTFDQGEASKIVVRGLAPQYNEVAVQGITLASTGSQTIGASSLENTAGTVSDDRSVDLTMVTPYMLKSIEVYKSLTPDMEANAIGGFVNMELREAPSGIHGDALWQSGYTQKSNTYGNYRAVASGSDRFFNDLLGVYILGDAEQYDRSADNLTGTYTTASSVPDPNGWRAVRVTGVTLNRHLETRERFGGNLILDYKLPSGSIQAVNMFSRLNRDSHDYNETLNYGSQNYDVDFSLREGNSNTDLAVNSLNLTNDFGFMSVNIEAANTYSRNHLPNSPYLTFQQNNAISHLHSVTGDTNITPQNLAHFVNYGPDSSTLLTSINLFSSDYHENDQIYKGDFKIPLNVGNSVSGFFKFGGEYRYNFHTNAQSTPYIQLTGGSGQNHINTLVSDSVLAHFKGLKFASTGQLEGSNWTSTDAKLTSSFLSNKFGGVYWAPDATGLNGLVNYINGSSSDFVTDNYSTDSGGWFDGPYQNQPNNYKYIERYYGAYLMSELDLGPNLLVVGGARFEQDKGLYRVYNMEDARNPFSQPVDTVTDYPQNHYWLPMVQGKYDLTDWADLRYSYTETLARPDYTQLSPHFSISIDSPHQVYAGNPNLRPGQAYNHDVELTLHSNDIGLFSIGGFYKTLTNFVYNTTYQLLKKSDLDHFGVTGVDSLLSFAPFLNNTSNAIVNTAINSRYKAYVKGIEADFETRFWYLPAPLNGVVLGINYTHIWSQAHYPYFDYHAARGVVTGFTDSTLADRLVDQPNDIMNSYIGYDYEGFSARVSFVFQGHVITSVGQFPEEDGLQPNYFRIDFSARQLLPWKGLQLFLDANNLNSESNISTQPSIGGFTSEQYYGFTGDLGIRYTL